MTGQEQRNAMQSAITTLSHCRVRIVCNHINEVWLDVPISERIDKAIAGLVGLIANLDEPDL